MLQSFEYIVNEPGVFEHHKRYFLRSKYLYTDVAHVIVEAFFSQAMMVIFAVADG